MQSQTKGTALITGASSGIGASYARQLAAQSYNLILVARRLERLEALAAEVSNQYSIRAEAIAADLTTAAGCETVERVIAGRDDLTLLVNNAGFGKVGTFSGLPMQTHLDMIAVHVTASVRLCYAAAPGMAARGRGQIINVASLAAFMPTNPGYCASKSYLVMFSEALQYELRGTGVTIQALCPGLTHTEFHDAPEFKTDGQVSKAPALMWMSADDVVAESLRALGKGPVICIPGWVNKVWGSLMRGPLSGLMMKLM